jgi:amino acid permease
MDLQDSMRRRPQQALMHEPQDAWVSQFRLARIVVVTFGAGVTSLGVLFALDGEIWLGAVLCVCGAVCILAGTFASRSRRQTPSREVQETCSDRTSGPGRFC